MSRNNSIHLDDFDQISDEDIRAACINLLTDGWELEAERVFQLWQDHERLKKISFQLHKQLNTQTPITVEHSKH